MDTGKFSFGVTDTLRAAEMGAAETLLVWEDLPIWRYEVKNPLTGEKRVVLKEKIDENAQNTFRDPVTQAELQVVGSMTLVEWLAQEYQNFGAALEFVTSRVKILSILLFNMQSEEGSQFVRGFGGIGALLRYPVDFQAFEEDANNEQEEEEEDLENPY